MTFSTYFSECVKRLENAAIEDANTDVRLLFEYLLNKKRNDLLMCANDEISAEDMEIIKMAISKREMHIPLQHITGYQNFMGLEFLVNDKVLVPRFDTECLVEEAIKDGSDGEKVLDMCTGSGCIIISYMHYKNNIEGYAADISDDALLVAKNNANRLNCDVTFVKSDLFENVDVKSFDMILSNPPYIKTKVIDTLMSEVKEHDPYIALDGGEDGLEFYRKIITDSFDYLNNGGRLIVEIGHDQGEEVYNLFKENNYRDVEVIKDLAGNDRVVKGKKPVITSG